MDSEDDDVEYEEIEEEVEVEEEVEEEIEVEEEVEEEEEEEAGEEELSDSAIDEDRNDVSQGMESKENEERLRSGSSDPENSVGKLSSDNLAVEGDIGNSKFSGGNETRQKGESFCVDVNHPKYQEMGKLLVASEDGGFRESAGDKKDSVAFPERETPKDDDACNDIKASLCDSGIVISETTKLLSVSGKEVAAAISTRDEFSEEANSVVCLEAEIKKMVTQSGEDINRGPTRFAVPQIRPRSLSLVDEFNDGNKRPAVLCDFFAKGWCIKGSSCRFLHIKDHVNITSQKPGGDVATLNEKNELLADGGLRDGTERSQSADFPNATASSVAYSSFSLERTPSWEHGENPRWHHFSERHKILSFQKEELSQGVSPDSLPLPIYKDTTRSISSFKNVGRENLNQNQFSDDNPIHRNICFPAHRSLASNSVLFSETNQITGTTSHATSLEDKITGRGQFRLYDRSSPVLSGSLNSSLSPSFPTSGILPSQNISAWTRSSFFSRSLDKDHLGAQKLLDSVGERDASRSASLLRTSSSFAGSESENYSLTNVSGDHLCIAGHKTKISSDDWKPSVPFQPQFFITQSLSSPGSLYDPIRDSIERPKLRDGFLKFSLRPESSITNTHPNIDGDPVLTRSLDPECGSDKHSISGHHKFHDDMSDKNFQGNDLFRTEGETVRISHTEQKNRSTLSKEEKLLSPAHVKDIRNANEINLDCDPRLPKDVPRQKKESEVDRGRQSNEMDVDLKTDREQKESKALKYFRVALIDFVKELVKPIWHEGRMSKDAHKMIVKKSVDKVLSTLQPHQTPSGAESIKQYLSASQPKISKLVEGYVVKYGKS